MSRAGDCYGNAVVESFFGTLKAEFVRDCVYPSRVVAIAAIGTTSRTSTTRNAGIPTCSTSAPSSSSRGLYHIVRVSAAPGEDHRMAA